MRIRADRAALAAGVAAGVVLLSGAPGPAPVAAQPTCQNSVSIAAQGDFLEATGERSVGCLNADVELVINVDKTLDRDDTVASERRTYAVGPIHTSVNTCHHDRDFVYYAEIRIDGRNEGQTNRVQGSCITNNTGS